MKQIHVELKNLYEQYREEKAPALVADIVELSKQVDIGIVSPPLLLKPFPEYEKNRLRIAIVAQCTFGWSWSNEEGLYPEWIYKPINSFGDFAVDEDSITHLMIGYELFKFSERQSNNRNSPFWRFYRTILEGLNIPKQEAGIWTNLFRVDVGGELPDGAILASVLKFQEGLLRKELTILNPHIVIFTTYWGYDSIIEKEFGVVRKYEIDGIEEQVLCRLEIPNQSFNAFRTYHPNYLQRSQNFDTVTDMLIKNIEKA